MKDINVLRRQILRTLVKTWEGSSQGQASQGEVPQGEVPQGEGPEGQDPKNQDPKNQDLQDQDPQDHRPQDGASEEEPSRQGSFEGEKSRQASMDEASMDEASMDAARRGAQRRARAREESQSETRVESPSDEPTLVAKVRAGKATESVIPESGTRLVRVPFSAFLSLPEAQEITTKRLRQQYRIIQLLKQVRALQRGEDPEGPGRASPESASSGRSRGRAQSARDELQVDYSLSVVSAEEGKEFEAAWGMTEEPPAEEAPPAEEEAPAEKAPAEEALGEEPPAEEAPAEEAPDEEAPAEGPGQGQEVEEKSWQELSMHLSLEEIQEQTIRYRIEKMRPDAPWSEIAESLGIADNNLRRKRRKLYPEGHKFTPGYD